MQPKLNRSDLDRRLREALRLGPSEQEHRLEEVRAAWARARAADLTRPGVVAPGEAPTAGRGRWVLAAAAVAVLALGVGLQLVVPPRVVADTLSRLQMPVRIEAAIRRAKAMSVRLELADAGGQLLRFRIAWRAPGDTVVRVEGPEGVTHRALKLPRADGGLLAPPPRGVEDTDPLLRPVRDFLSPDRVAALLEGEERRVTIDPRTDLPVRLEADVVASFDWEPGPLPSLPLGDGRPRGR